MGNTNKIMWTIDTQKPNSGYPTGTDTGGGGDFGTSYSPLPSDNCTYNKFIVIKAGYLDGSAFCNFHKLEGPEQAIPQGVWIAVRVN